MSLNEDVASEIQKLDPSSVIELFVLDPTLLGGEIFRFHNGTNKLSQNLVWQGEEYVRFPIQVTGFEINGQGQFPRPVISVSNVMSAITTVMLQYKDLIGSKFTRKRTLLKFLDAVNFPGGVNPTADPDAFISDDIFYVDKKASEDRDEVHFELASSADLQGVKIPKRVVIQSSCPWIYRGADCGYTGIPLYDENDNQIPPPTSAEAIAMMAARSAVFAAQSALATAQTNLANAANTMTAAAQYTTETRYSITAPLNYIQSAFFGTVAYWDDTPVGLGTTYTQGDYVADLPNLYFTIPTYKILKHTRDEAAYSASVTAYNNAVTARNTAASNVTSAQIAFDAALAAVPPTDDVYKQDRCGKRLSSCKLRFGETNPLSFGGFPGVGR